MNAIFSSGLIRSHRGYSLERIYDFQGRKVRVKLYRDFYEHQSRYVAEVWSGEHEQWHEVARIHPESNDAKSMPNTSTKDDEKLSAALTRMEGRLLDVAASVL